MAKMNWLVKPGLVIGGYILACLAAYGAGYVNDKLTPPDVLQASAGMSAFGDMVLFVGVLGVCAIVPTGLGIYFLVRKTVKR